MEALAVNLKRNMDLVPNVPQVPKVPKSRMTELMKTRIVDLRKL